MRGAGGGSGRQSTIRNPRGVDLIGLDNRHKAHSSLGPRAPVAGVELGARRAELEEQQVPAPPQLSSDESVCSGIELRVVVPLKNRSPVTLTSSHLTTTHSTILDSTQLN
ncbi:unnamed protein product [Protopolystoma xenopodis]|uniref:Uncharacterized protein n=1 Tax=Protopolystoma xenopodis TaxID=117903 RepID=A0A3S5AZL0_9PLAT|nr:unnamed protein product [Protopolystoma xenopodis]